MNKKLSDLYLLGLTVSLTMAASSHAFGQSPTLTGRWIHVASSHGRLGWLEPYGPVGRLIVVYEFHTDGTMAEYTQVRYAQSEKGSRKVAEAVRSSPRVTGIYSFKQNHLVYHPIGVEFEGKTQMFTFRAPDETFNVVLSDNKLELMRATRIYAGQEEDYQRQ